MNKLLIPHEYCSAKNLSEVVLKNPKPTNLFQEYQVFCSKSVFLIFSHSNMIPEEVG